jgi:tetratricopeptide (TPR) repeat protein
VRLGRRANLRRLVREAWDEVRLAQSSGGKRPRTAGRSARDAPKVALAAALAVITFLVYSPVLQNEFLNFDDDHYILDNPNLRAGLSWPAVRWAFTTGYGANWFPLTWLSWMLDVSLHGFDPRGFHLTNLLLHCLNVVLLFLVLARMTGAPGRSAFVAGVLALHPLHVESVAWAAVRKDVLSGLFAVLALWAYARYAARPGLRRYLLVALSLGLGLMAKPMLVSLPFVFLLLDVWPLGRRPRVLEKLPLLALSAASSVVTLAVQRASGAVQSFEVYPLRIRLLNALVSYVTYLRKAFWPIDLAVYYPHPGETVSVGGALAALLVLVVVSILVLRSWSRRPYLAVGWLWFLGSLVPVSGLVQVGQQALADRYMYIPLIGISIIVAWGAVDLVEHSRLTRRAAAVAGSLALAALGFMTSLQVRLWHDSLSLFEHALRVTKDNAVAHLNLGIALLDRGRLDEAAGHLREAIRIHPGSAEAHGALGEALAREGRREEALEHFDTALRLEPRLSRVQNGFGRALADEGRADEALVHFREAAAIDPFYAEAYNNIGSTLLAQGAFTEAIEYFERAVALQPGLAEAHNNWGLALAAGGKVDEAIAHFQTAAGLRPGDPGTQANWGLALARRGDFEGAAGRYRAALALRPDDATIHSALGLALAHLGDFQTATEAFEKAATLRPRDAEIQNNWGMALASLGDLEQAIAHYRTALSLDGRYAEAHNSLGIALGSRGRLDEAIRHFATATSLRPGYAEAYNNWGLALAQRGQLDEAVARLRDAVRIDPEYSDAHNNLGVFLARQGRLDEAAEHFRETLRLDPGRADAKANLNRILAARAS